MPNRILRDWTDSKKVNRLSAEAERLFTRLIMKADDYGRFHADPVMIKSLCFPRNEEVTTKIIQKLLPELSSLMKFYEVDGEEYLEIMNFEQRLRLKKEKFPKPTNKPKNEDDGHMTVKCQSDDGHMAAGCLHETKRNETETETETETKTKPKASSADVVEKKFLILDLKEKFSADEKLVADWCYAFGVDELHVRDKLDQFVADLKTQKIEEKTESDFLKHFRNWWLKKNEKKSDSHGKNLNAGQKPEPVAGAGFGKL